MSAYVFWLFAEALFGKLNEITHNQRIIMAEVRIEQGDLDTVAGTLEALVEAIGTIDTSKLDPADQTALQTAVTDVTSAVNAKLPVTVPTGEGAV